MNQFFTRLPLLARVWLFALLVGSYAGLAVWKERSSLHGYWDQPAEIHEVFALVLGLLLVFRTNRAYERWWEARKLWGRLICTSRNQAVKIMALAKPPAKDLQQCRTIVTAFPYALKEHLRDGCVLQQVPGFETAQENPQHVPSYLVLQLYDFFHKWKKDGLISDEKLRIFDREASNLVEICGGCERIRKTLMPQSYRTFLRQLIFLHLATLPWGLVDKFQDLTVAVVIGVAYFMIGTEAIAHSIEEPFGSDCDDLDLETYCDKIDTTVGEIFS